MTETGQPDRAGTAVAMLRDLTEAVAAVAARMLGLDEAEESPR